jgi:hypothetical protein
MINAHEVEKIQGSANVDTAVSSFPKVSHIRDRPAEDCTLLHFPEAVRLAFRRDHSSPMTTSSALVTAKRDKSIVLPAQRSGLVTRPVGVSYAT